MYMFPYANYAEESFTQHLLYQRRWHWHHPQLP